MDAKTRLTIIPADLETEILRLESLIRDIPFFKNHGYDLKLLSLPEEEVFVSLYEKSPNLSPNDLKILYAAIKEKYDPKVYDLGIQTFESVRPILEYALARFHKLNRLWEFKICPEYKIVLSKYGMGSYFYSDTGVIVVGFKPNGSVGRHRPEQIAIHEWVHIGIQDSIVVKYKLTHPEKERLVDLICTYIFPDLVGPDYKMQEIGDQRLDPVVTQEALENLSSAIERYVSDNPR